MSLAFFIYAPHQLDLRIIKPPQVCAGFVIALYLHIMFPLYLVNSFFVDSHNALFYFYSMGKRIYYNTTMEEDLMKQFKILAIEEGKRQNQLLEEAIKDLLKKYGKDKTPK